MRNRPEEKPLQNFKVAEPSELLEFLIENNARKNRSAAKSLLAHKQIKVNGKIVTQFDFPLKRGDKIEVMKYDQSRREKRLKGMKIVFEDKDIIVIDKEAGVLSVSTDKEKENTIYGVLKEYVKKKNKNARVFVLHRLDQQVSGLMIFAKDPEIQIHYQKNWNILVPIYNYVAVVYGQPEPKNGTIKSWLTENKNFVVFANETDNGGQESITHYETIKSNERYSLLSFKLETRRKNQIRAQMKLIGHSVVGDKKYGAESNPIKRIALHAQDMTIKHPVSGRMLEFKSTIPKVIVQLLEKDKIKRDEREDKTNRGTSQRPA